MVDEDDEEEETVKVTNAFLEPQAQFINWIIDNQQEVGDAFCER